MPGLAARPLAIGLLLIQGLVQGPDPSENGQRLIQDRRAFMARLGATLRAAWEKFDAGELAALDGEARQVAAAVSRIPEFFPPGSFGEGSRARASISEQQGEFGRLSTRLRLAAEALVEQIRTQDQETIRAGLLQVGSACRACHRKFVEHPR